MFISKNIVYLKEVKGISYRDIELLSGVGHSVVYYIAKGRIKDPSSSSVIGIARALEVTIDELLLKDLEKENVPVTGTKEEK